MPPLTFRFQDRTALVTGAASDIGRATALRRASEGAAVAVVDRDVNGGLFMARAAGRRAEPAPPG